MVSIIVPSRNERFLVPTVHDLLKKAAGEIEVIVILDGYWGLPGETLPDDPRVTYLHFGDAHGMRPGINAAVQLARGKYLLKSDAHCMWDEGYDQKLTADYLEGNWILTPRRHALDAEAWAIDTSQPEKYPVDYEALSWPYAHPDDPLTGFHGQAWTSRRRKRKDILLDTDMSSQGSAWFMSRAHWNTIGPMRMDLFGSFFGESQEIGLVTQMRGGAMMRSKNTWYAHLRKSTKYGRGYSLGPSGHKNGAALMLRMCLMNEWPNQSRTLESLIQEFWPVPGWPTDWESVFASKRAAYRQVAA